MIPREIQAELEASAREYPIVTVTGPRQSGKTTLVQMAFPDLPYVSLEDPDRRRVAESDPRGFLAELGSGGILDEIQRAPELLSFLQGLVDTDPRPGRFILTGSNQPELRQTITQTLAGRNALLTLLPFTFDEARSFRPKLEPFDLVVRGTMPRVHHRRLRPTQFFRGYFRTYVERDVRLLVNLRNADAFDALLRLLAGRVGQLVNYASLSNDVGVSSTTIRQWISILRGSFIIFSLPSFSANVRKRVVKSPKLYFTDVGLAAWLLGLESADHVRRDPCRGGLFENLVIAEIAKWYTNAGFDPDLYFYRDSNGNEVDLLCRRGRKLTPIEIKSAETFSPDFVKGIERFREATTEQSEKGYVLYAGAQTATVRTTSALSPFHHREAIQQLREALFPESG